ncbi:MAG: FAD-dependent tricarballylate dehydrogenase TcuA [Burkholderiales bacterium]|nr:FAD-dependent tricarballylate dehydrogenase TcuA [Burkholderiales bacterium]
MTAEREAEVLVIGGGNAALCAAITAAEAGARVLLLECAPRHYRGGNSRHTRNIRCMHRAPTRVLTEAYPEDEYYEDLLKVTGGNTDEALARHVIRTSEPAIDWMSARGVRFQPSLGGTLHLSRTNAFFLGGGKALVNTYFHRAERLGVEVLYEAEAIDLALDAGRCSCVTVRQDARTFAVRARAVVVASGGFESNLAWLREAWGPAADNFLIRGTPYNMGRVLRALIDRGAQAIGDPTQCHAAAIDARAPKFDGGIVTRVDCVSLGIVVNREGVRFYDEGEDFWPQRDAIWGRLVAQQPGQIAWAIIDRKPIGRFMPPVFPGVRADSIAELAAALGLPVQAVVKTVQDYNRAVQPGHFDHAVLDGCRTRGLSPEKTHWALPIDSPPYYGYPLRPGITFTYLGVKVTPRAQVQLRDGGLAKNLYAAGEVMAGNILSKGYLAGIGMTIGTVYGRIAGEEAARHAAGARQAA